MQLSKKEKRGELYYNPNSSDQNLLFTFFKKYKDSVLLSTDVLQAKWMEDEKGLKQGIEQNFGFGITTGELLPNQKKILELSDGRIIVSFIAYTPTYKDGHQNGLAVGYRQDGSISYTSVIQNDHANGPECSFNPKGEMTLFLTYKDNDLNGLQIKYDSHGKPSYSFYQNGEVLNGVTTIPLENDKILKSQWKMRVENLKKEKEVDREERSLALKNLLEATTKEKRKSVLKEFHSKCGPEGIKRRTALKFER